VDRLGRGLTAASWAPDGVIEAIEGDGPTLYLGVQWHAEALVERDRHAALFEALVAAAADETARAAA
jgi:putative glutamine amidotransferase